MKNRYSAAIVSGIVVILVLVWYYVQHPLAPKLLMGGEQFTVELAISPEEKQKGLGERQGIAAQQGMLFVYDHPEQYAFWMKGMQFPLDIIWINGTEIVDIAQNVPVATGGALPTYAPQKPADKVLEVNAGTTQRLGVHVGDSIQILKR